MSSLNSGLDRNRDGKVDLKDLAPNAGLNQGLGMNRTATANPLDRNHDGRVDLKDLSNRQGMGMQGMGMNQGFNPLDRNMDGKVDMQDFSSGAYVQSSRRASYRAEPTVIETIQKDVVIHERIHPVQKEEIQPIIYREREQLDVKQVTQMLHETQIQPTIIQQRELPAERRAAVVERAAPIAENFIAPLREVDVTMRSQVVHAPIVNEIIKKTVIEEIQPVLERDIIQSTVYQNTQPIYEKYVDAPQVYRETRVVSERRLSGAGLESLVAQGFNLGSLSELGLNQSTMATSTMPAQMLSSDLNRGVSSSMMYSSEIGTASRRKSLVEALPTSYSYLMNSQESKLLEQQRLQRDIESAPLPSPIL